MYFKTQRDVLYQNQMLTLCMSFSTHWCSLKIAINNSRNTYEWLSIYGQTQFVGNKIISAEIVICMLPNYRILKENLLRVSDSLRHERWSEGKQSVVIISLYQCSLFLLSICHAACCVENQSYRFEAEICSVDRSVTQIETEHLSLPDNRGINVLSLHGECVVYKRKTKVCLVPTLLAPLTL